MKRVELQRYLADLLQIDTYQDYAPNGLQVEGSEKVQKVVTGVTACEALIDAAIEASADTLLVHHGYFWKSEKPEIVGYKQRRIKKLLQHNINLFAYHLPLDGHPELGNNAQLAKLWGVQDCTPQTGLLRLGQLSEETPIESFIERVALTLSRQPLHLPGGPKKVKKIAWCSGGAQNYIEQAAQWGADVYVSGEVSEQTTHLAKELGVHYLAAGHHATERYGAKALGEHIAEKFDLTVKFMDVPNPV